VYNCVQWCISKILIVNLIEQRSNRLQQKVIFVQMKQTGPESESPAKQRLRLELDITPAGVCRANVVSVIALSVLEA